MKRLVGLTAVALMILTGCAVSQKSLQEKGLKPITQKELEENYSRPVKIRWVNVQNQTGTAEYTPDGVARLQWQGGGATGRWRIADGKFCTTYPEIRGGAEACFVVYRTTPKETVSFAMDGSYNATATAID